MELSGEITSGYFFEGIHGLQFISHKGLRFLKSGLTDSIFWMNATDPASLSGIKLEGMQEALPSRLVSNHLVFHGTKLVLISKKSGKQIQIFVPPDHPMLQEYYSFFKTLLDREFKPRRSLLVEVINDEPALSSPYADSLKGFGFSSGYKGLELYRKY